MRLFFLLIITFALLGSGGFATAQICQSSATRYAKKIEAVADVDGMAPAEHPEVFGRTPFFQEAGENRVFALIPVPHGWAIRVYEAPYSENSVDLSQITLPREFKIDPRDILGWQFRDSANTKTLDTARKDRLFFFSDGLAGTGGYRPPYRSNTQAPALVSSESLGWLKILDYGLTDLDKGQKARMNYMKFDACLTWPKTKEEQAREADLASLAFTPNDIKQFKTCGLNAAKYELHANLLPRKLQGDFDGDGTPDTATLIRRKKDGKRGLAICRGGSVLNIVDVVGMDAKAGDALQPGYLEQMGAWRLLKKNREAEGYIGEENWPRGDGDILALERIEKELVLVFYKDRALQSYHAYHVVTE